MNGTVAWNVSDASQVFEARREAVALAARCGFSEVEAGKVAIAVTEAATNLVKHGHGGDIILRPITADDRLGLELLTIDKGPGMINVQECLRDGYSTAGSPGTGLGAIMRQSAEFDLYSQPGKGTALMARFWSGAKPNPPLMLGVINIPIKGETVCGDAWSMRPEAGGANWLMVADGLGHGFHAAQASQEAVRVFQEAPLHTPSALLQSMHQVLRSTRGAAVSIAVVDAAAGKVRYAGVGNISGVIVAADGASKHMVAHNGTLGAQASRMQEFTYDWPSDGLVILTSDGIRQWNLSAYPGLTFRHPALVAAVIYRDFLRGRDDATVLVARRKP